MRNEHHSSLKFLQYSFRNLLEMTNKRVMTAYGKSSIECFSEEEAALRASLLPTAFVYKHQTKVKKNYHVILSEDWHQYSVPHEYIGKEVKLIYNDDAVEVFLDYRRITVPRLNLVRHGYSTVDTHKAESHRRSLLQQGLTSDDFIE